jgi:hypothetical protein
MDLNKKTFKCSKKLYWGRLGQNLSKAKKKLKKSPPGLYNTKTKTSKIILTVQSLKKMQVERGGP